MKTCSEENAKLKRANTSSQTIVIFSLSIWNHNFEPAKAGLRDCQSGVQACVGEIVPQMGASTSISRTSVLIIIDYIMHFS